LGKTEQSIINKHMKKHYTRKQTAWPRLDIGMVFVFKTNLFVLLGGALLFSCGISRLRSIRFALNIQNIHGHY